MVALSQILVRYAVIKPISTLTAEQARMATELDVAAHIQQAMLPARDAKDDAVFADIGDFVGDDPQFDDITMVLLEV